MSKNKKTKIPGRHYSAGSGDRRSVDDHSHHVGNK